MDVSCFSGVFDLRQTGWSVLDVEETWEIFSSHAPTGRIGAHSDQFVSLMQEPACRIQLLDYIHTHTYVVHNIHYILCIRTHTYVVYRHMISMYIM